MFDLFTAQAGAYGHVLPVDVARRLHDVAQDLATSLMRWESLTRRLLTRLMTDRFGGGDDTGAWSMRDRACSSS